MGFIKSVRALQKQGEEVSRTWDVGAQLAGAQQSMAATQTMLAQQTQAASLATTGQAAVATITAARQGHGLVGYQPVVEFELLVMADGRPPVPVTVSQVVDHVHLARAQAGARVPVMIDPAHPATVWIDWAAPHLV